MSIWPNFFIVGAPKAGTTSLYEYLKVIPGIYMSPLKEPNFFRSEFPSKNRRLGHVRSKKEYLNLFENAKAEKIIGEASPSYLEDPKSAYLIHETIPNALILISLRDPVERLFSAYLMLIKIGLKKLTFHEEILNAIENISDPASQNWLRRGTYFDEVKRYLKIFGQKQVKILIFEEWVKDPKETTQEILQFLGLNHNINNFETKKHNPFLVARSPLSKYILKNKLIIETAQKFVPSSTRKMIKENILTRKKSKPIMEQKDRSFLINYYKDDVKKLEDLLGRKLPWKNFSN